MNVAAAAATHPLPIVVEVGTLAALADGWKIEVQPQGVRVIARGP